MDNNVENNINSEFNGLTAAEVNARIEAGKINIADDSSDRTTGKIIRDNLLTYFNLIFLVITVLLCIAGAFRDLTFLPIIIGNILIGIVQELRAKKTLDKMKILNAGHAVVNRLELHIVHANGRNAAVVKRDFLGPVDARVVFRVNMFFQQFRKPLRRFLSVHCLSVSPAFLAFLFATAHIWVA